MDTTQEILNKLKLCKEMLAEKYGIEQLGLFGSSARNEQNEDSDIDIVVKMKHPNLLTRLSLRIELEKFLNRRVDLISLHEHLFKDFLQNVERDAIYV